MIFEISLLFTIKLEMVVIRARKISFFTASSLFSQRRYRLVCHILPNILPNFNNFRPERGLRSVARCGNLDFARHLFEEFSKTPNLRNEEELQSLGKRLTPEAVENVLKGLRGWRRAHEFFLWSSRQESYRHNCYTYNAMAQILSRSQRSGLLRSLAREVVENHCEMTPGALGFLIRCLGDLGLIEEAIYLVDNAERMGCAPNSYTYNCLLEVLARAGKVEMVESRVKDMVIMGMCVDKYTMTPVLKAYCNAGRLERALLVFDEMIVRGWGDEYVFTLFLVSLCKCGEVNRTWELLERMKKMNMELKERTFFVLIHGFLKEGELHKALCLFEKMKESKFRGDLALYSALIVKLCEENEVEKALELYSEMKGSTIFPDIHLVSKMISSFCSSGEFMKAQHLLKVDGEAVDSEKLVLLYNAVLMGLVNFGDISGAHSLLRTMMGSSETDSTTNDRFTFKEMVKPNEDSFCIVVTELCKTKKLETACQLVDDMLESGYKGNLLMYNNLINELSSVDRLQESLNLLKKMTELGLEPSQFTHNSIFGCLCRREDFQASADFLKIMRKYGHAPWIKHLTLLVQKLCKKGKIEEACKLLDDMVEMGFVPDMITYSAAIHVLCSIGDLDRALEIFRRVSLDWYLPDVVAHNIIINGFCNAGRLSEAKEIVREMVERGLLPSVITYNIMMNALCKDDSIDGALLCFSEILNDDSKSPTVVSFTILIHGLLSAKRPDDALFYWNNMREKGCHPNKISYSALIHGLCRCGMEDAALSYFFEMGEVQIEPDVSVYIMLLNSLALKGKSIKAVTVLSKMVQKFAFSTPVGKNYELLRDALKILHSDVNTASNLVRLIDEGRIPVFDSISALLGKDS